VKVSGNAIAPLADPSAYPDRQAAHFSAVRSTASRRACRVCNARFAVAQIAQYRDRKAVAAGNPVTVG
jgi:hypothetical protein